MIKPIVLYGNKILRQPCLPYNTVTQTDELVQDLWDTMYNANGVGLATPQIGVEFRIFVIDLPDEKWKEVFINPRIIEYSGDDVIVDEACLSIPSMSAIVSRKDTIKIEWYDEYWTSHVEEFSGLKARVIQHEYDHLDGILYVDRTNIKYNIQMITSLQKLQRRDLDDMHIKYPVI